MKAPPAEARRAHIEALEPRILLSADVPTALLDPAVADPGAAWDWATSLEEPLAEEASAAATTSAAEAASREVAFVDAGHGYALHIPAGKAPEVIQAEGGLVAGVDATYAYQSERLDCSPGDRIVVFSDGVVEQPSPGGEQFGLPRALEALTGSSGCVEDVECIFDAVLRFADTDSLADDVTVASIELRCDSISSTPRRASRIASS